MSIAKKHSDLLQEINNEAQEGYIYYGYSPKRKAHLLLDKVTGYQGYYIETNDLTDPRAIQVKGFVLIPAA